MSFFLDYCDKLEKKRDATVKKFIRDNYSILLQAGTIDMNLSRKYVFWSCLLAIFNYAVLANQDWMLLYSTFLLKDDFETASGDLNYFLLISVSIGFLCNFHYYREDFLDGCKIMSGGLFQYADHMKETEDMIKFRKHMRFQRNLLIALAIYVCNIGGIVVLGPVIDDYTGHGFNGTYDENGVNRRLPVPLFLPFESINGIGYLTALGMTTISGTVTCAVIGGASFLFSTFSHQILTELKILSCSIKAISSRALKMYCRIHNVSKKSVDRKTLYSNPMFQDCITECIKENIKHYTNIAECMEVVERFVKIPVFLSFLIVTLAIGLSMMKLNEDIVRIGSSVSFASVAIGEILNMLSVAVNGEHFLTLSHEVNWEIYFTPWYKFNLKNKKMIRQFLQSTQNELYLSAWIVRFDMEMFASVVNSAYSFFNFLKLSKTINVEEM
uniref:Odorant receptor n=1 Tax=Adelphocoris lineolatus TaxID=236346 RepID=A0A2I4PH19_ADELI|nr:olfactory receptor 22 [Adelphocoris lineolatus]